MLKHEIWKMDGKEAECVAHFKSIDGYQNHQFSFFSGQFNKYCMQFCAHCQPSGKQLLHLKLLIKIFNSVGLQQ